MAKVSIIIPIYNVEKYVKKTIESAIKQTEKDIEIILVDDGSTDTSVEICDEYASKDGRIVVIHKENAGLSSARNTGTQIATSEYVMYLDGDDYLRENTVERVLQVMKEYPSDFIQYQYQEVIEGKISAEKNACEEIFQAHTARELFENLYALGGVAASGATKLLRRDLMLEIPFVSIRHEDEMWCTQAFRSDLTVTYIPDKLYYYVMRKNSIIHSTFNRKKLDIFQVMDARVKVLSDLKLYNLLGTAYRKIFLTILELYVEANKVKDHISMRDIKQKFEEYSKKIEKYADLDMKFEILFKLMNFKFEFIKFYELYRNS